MRKFKIEVTRTVEYEVEINETVYTDEAREGWENTFWPLDEEDNAEAFACELARQSIRLGANEFIEGFGRVMQNKEQAGRYKQHHSDINDNIFIREINDDYIETEVKEVKNFNE